tara:strand:+ start:10661 stop:12040 length:1380 start_codon:yes stop_codon:yes gene_type:complete
MVAIATNIAESTLASGINNSVTSLTVATGHGAKFPNPSGDDYFYVTLIKVSDYTALEIVKCTGRSGDDLTVVRAQDGTSALSFITNDRVELRPVAGIINDYTSLINAGVPKVVVSDSTANTDFPVAFHNESNALLDDTGTFIYNPSTGRLSATQLAGTLQTAAQANITSVGTLTSATVSGATTTGTLRITDETDVSVSSTGHGLQIGPSNGTNIAMDGNEIMARSNGSAATLNLQAEGGKVAIQSEVEIEGAHGTNLFINHNTSSNTTWNTAIKAYNSALAQGDYNQIQLGKAGSNYNSGGIYYYWDSAGSASNNWIGLGHYGNADVLKVYGDKVIATHDFNSTGNITAYYSSDERLKENITEIDSAVDKVKNIRGVNFDWVDKEIDRQGGEDGYFVRKNDVGVIAQEIEEVLPEVVAERDDGYKAVRYEKIIPLLIQAIKEQQIEIDKLKEKLDEQKR